MTNQVVYDPYPGHFYLIRRIKDHRGDAVDGLSEVAHCFNHDGQLDVFGSDVHISKQQLRDQYEIICEVVLLELR